MVKYLKRHAAHTRARALMTCTGRWHLLWLTGCFLALTLPASAANPPGLTSGPPAAIQTATTPPHPNVAPAQASQWMGLVATTHPLYLIAKAVTQGIEQPVRLLAPNQTGHDLQLNPQALKRLKQANFVVWLGAGYEQGLAHRLHARPNSIALLDLPAFRRLPQRNARAQPLANTLDAHLWLDPVNASAMAHAIAAVRSRQFPQHASRYQANARQFSRTLLTTMQRVKRQAMPRPYWAYHDAYQYLESSLNLQFKGSLTVDHNVPPTLSQLQWLQQQRRGASSQVRCLLSESVIAPATLQALQPLKVAYIDETMQAYGSFTEGWAALAQQVQQCQ